MPHSGIGIVSFSIACLTSILIPAMWAAIHLRLLSNQMDAILFLVAGVMTFSAALSRSSDYSIAAFGAISSFAR